MKRIITFTSLALVILGNYANAQILGTNELKIDFTDQNDAKAKATWSEPDKISITQHGLGGPHSRFISPLSENPK